MNTLLSPLYLPPFPRLSAVLEEDTCRFSGVEVLHVPVNDADSDAGELRKYFESVAEKMCTCVCGYSIPLVLDHGS